jgi:endonuclease/exonuclease/phosphatase family metal-dependent hydrolase
MPTNDLRVMTFNIRNSGANDGANRWAHRRDLWAATVRAFDPHLLGVQEVLPDQHADLLRMFPDYG